MTARHIHFLGICGYAVSGGALLAQEQGNVVTGSDDQAYPPTTDVLTAAGVRWVDGSDPANLDRWGVPDQGVVGNQTRPGNPEWLEAQRRGLPILSEIEFYALLAQDRTRLAVCGTHGKTTTTALLVSILQTAGLDPGLRLGSVSLDLGVSARLGTGPFVFEGDEYSSSPWDVRPKFLHMDPKIACVTRLELDHPDIYPDLDAYRAPFVELAHTMPSDGTLVLCADDAEALALQRTATANVITYGTDATKGPDCLVKCIADDGAHQRISLSGVIDGELELTFPGEHNALNAAAAVLMAVAAGADFESCARASRAFLGPARRFQILGDVNGITVVDDYAHHPTECAAALAAARRRWPLRRLVAVHTPHTYSRTRALLNDYAGVFSQADELLLGPIEAARERGQPVTVTSDDVLDVVTAPPLRRVTDGADQTIEYLRQHAEAGDVIVVLSLGGFDKLAPRLMESLDASHV